MASVFVKPGNRWFACYTDAAGRRVRRRVKQQTKRDALKVARALEAREERVRVGLELPEQKGELVGPLMRRWALSLENRNADLDRARVDNHVLPRWRNVRITDVDVARVLDWLAAMKAARKIGPQSQRHCLGLLSRFMSWAIPKYAQRNPCRDLPPSKRPHVVGPRDVPWLGDDEQVVRIMHTLPAPFDAVFFVGNRSGARLSEILSLRLSDLADIDQGRIRIRFAGDDGEGPLKERRKGDHRPKPAPIPPADARVVLRPILDARRAAGADDEAFVFVDQDGDKISRHAVGHVWRKMRQRLGLPAGLNFYRATRHSAVNRAAAAGAEIAEIADSLGHASEATTRAHYLHHVRKTFSPKLTAEIGLAKVIPLQSADAERGPAEPGKGATNAA